MDLQSYLALGIVALTAAAFGYRLFRPAKKKRLRKRLRLREKRQGHLAATELIEAAHDPCGFTKGTVRGYRAEVVAALPAVDEAKKTRFPEAREKWNGLANPLVHRLGILSEDTDTNSVPLDKQGRILTVISGLTPNKDGRTMPNAVSRQDERVVDAFLEKGEIDKAREFIMALAPPFDPEAVDEKGRKITRKPEYNLAHLRARAKVSMAMKDWENALADAEEVVQRQLGTDGGMSLRTPDLDEAEALRDRILGMREEAGGSR